MPVPQGHHLPGRAEAGDDAGPDYLYHFALPNFFFHYATAYGILRHCGVEVGKFDFMGKIPGFPPM